MCQRLELLPHSAKIVYHIHEWIGYFSYDNPNGQES